MKKDMENGDKEEVEAVESETEENGVEEDADPLATNGGDEETADEPENDKEAPDNADEEDEEDDDKPLKSVKKAAKKEKKAAKKAAKKKSKKRVSLNVPADKVDPEDETEEEEYEVQSIVDHRYVGKKLEYKIRWKGYTAKDDTWEAKNSLNCPDIIKKYEASEDTSQNGKKSSKAATPKRKGGKPATSAAKKARVEESEEEDDGDGEEEYEVAHIIDVRNKKGGKREFLIRWKGYGARYDNWEPEENLNCNDLIAQFDKKLEKAKSATQKELRAVPKTTKRYAVDLKHKGARTSKRGGGRTRVTYYDDE